MDFSVANDLQALLGAVRRFLENEVYLLEARMADDSFANLLPDLERARSTVKANGWWLPQIAKEHGGLGLSLVDHGLLSAELGRTPFGNFVFNCQAPDSGNMEILIQHGTPDQKARWLEPLLDGKTRSCFSMTEPENPGSNPTMMDTTALKDGDDYVINGHKWFTSSADGAAFAVVMAVTNPDAPAHERTSQIIVPTDTPGFTIVQNTSVMGERGDGWASHAEIRYEDCRVPQSNLLGKEGAGFVIAQERLGPGRIHHCMRWIGICERAIDLMCRHSIRREVAPGVALATRQFIHGWLAESRAEVDAARLMVLHTAWAIEKFGAKETRNEISEIKFFVANVLQRVLDRAIQALGGLGVTDATPLAYYWRHERAARIYDGPDEVHKIVLAKRILKQYAAATTPSLEA